MAHNIANINGIDSVFLANNSAWHGLGQVVMGAQSWKQAMELANLNWNVEKQQLFDQTGKAVPYWGVFREGQVFLGAVGKSYTPIQNEYAFEFVDALLGVEEGAHYETAGALGNGERIWCLARVPYDYSVQGVDKHQTYLLFTTSHDGSLAATCKLTSVRVVCQNTLNQAMAMNGSFTRVKHTRQAEEKLERAKAMMGKVVNGVHDIEDKLNTLSMRMLDRDSYVGVLDKLFPISDSGQNKDKASSTRRDGILLEITKLFESNDNNTFPEFRGTAYNLLNAVTEYTDHYRNARLTGIAVDMPKQRDMVLVGQARKEQALFGTGDALKSKALDIILDVTRDCKKKERPIYSLPSEDVIIKPAPPVIDITPTIDSPKDTGPKQFKSPKPSTPITVSKPPIIQVAPTIPVTPSTPSNPPISYVMQCVVATLPDAIIYVRETPKDAFGDSYLKVVYRSNTTGEEKIGEMQYRGLSEALTAIRNKWPDAPMIDQKWEVYQG